MPKVVFLGSANMDTSIQLEGDFPERGTAECLNRVVSIMRTPGGKALNQALAFKKQYPDADVCFVGCIGGVPSIDENGNTILVPDESGKPLYDILHSEKTGFSEVVLKMFHEVEAGKDENGNPIIKKIKTDGRIIQVDSKGDNRMTGYGDAIKQLTPEKVPEMEAVLNGADMVVIQLKMPAVTVRYVMDYCEKNGIKLLVDPTPLENSKILAENDCELLRKATYLSPNEEEAFALAMYVAGKTVDEVKALLAKTSPEARNEMIKTLVKTSPNVFATMGGDGVIFSKDGKVISQETYPTHCKNSTGAGDTFNGAFAAALMRDEDYEDALLYGLYVSAIKVQEEGAQNGVLSLEETEERMGEIERPPFVEIDEDEKVLEEVVENETTLVISIDDNDGDDPRVD